jgi:peptide/nickel transport system permease protein
VTGFLLRRLFYLVLLVLISTSVAYLLAATQLNPRSRYEGRNPPPPEAVVDSVLEAVNMNDKTPLPERFMRWTRGVVRGDLGRTIENNSVNEELGRRMWVSLRLLLIGALLGLGGACGSASGCCSSARCSARRSGWRPAPTAP